MATSLTKAISDILKCAICRDTMTRPRMLSCQHSFCIKCLQDMGVHDVRAYERGFTPGGTIQCPTCRKATRVPRGGLSRLPLDYTLNSLADLPPAEAPPAEPLKTQCVVCIASDSSVPGPDTVDWICEDCQVYMCERCAEAHAAVKVFEDHVVVVVRGVNVRKGMCQQHPVKRREYFCEDCSELVCSVCLTASHHNHVTHDAYEYLHANMDSIREQISSFEELRLDPDLEHVLSLADVIDIQAMRDFHRSIYDKIDQVKLCLDSQATLVIRAIQEAVARELGDLDKEKDRFRQRCSYVEKLIALKPKADALQMSLVTFQSTDKPVDVLDELDWVFKAGLQELKECKDELDKYCLTQASTSYCMADLPPCIGYVVKEDSDVLARRYAFLQQT